MLKKLIKNVKQPGAEFRGVPFWAWNSKLDPQELRRQVNVLKDMGLGGFFMHARVGLNTQYLGEDWFNCVKASVDEAKKLGMRAWLYDEDRWPSGAAGGLVTRDVKNKMRVLAYQELTPGLALPPDPDDEVTLSCFSIKFDGQKIVKYRRVDPAKAKAADGTLIRYFRKINLNSSWYNNQTYLDTMNKDAVREFVKVTHDAYKREISGEFNGTVPGIFTDEPAFLMGNGVPDCMPWTDRIPAEFRKAYGYDLLDHMPEIYYFMKDSEFSRVRLNYYDLLTRLFVNAYSKEIGSWCKKNKMQFTGHVMAEDTLMSQRIFVGSAMRFYEYMQAPGIDLLTEHWFILDTAKQCTSMAHQFGRRWRLSETYGCTGWDFPFFGHKALGDWQYAMGINLRCLHLSWYSMEGQAKRDYPASIFSQSPWYKFYPAVENYFARLGAALSEGEEQRDLLVIHPIESTWGVTPHFGWDPERCEEETRSLIRLRNRVLSINVDFDYGEEEVMSRHASAEGALLKVGKAKYKAVLIPELRTIRNTTLQVLSEFSKHGGKVFYCGKVPVLVDGKKSSAATAKYKLFTALDDHNFAAEISAAARKVSITDAQGVEINPALHLLRRKGSQLTLFLCNMSDELSENQMGAGMVRDRKLSFDTVNIQVLDCPAEANIYELDLNTGALYPVSGSVVDGTAKFVTSLPQLGSRLFFLTPEKVDTVARPSVLSGKAAKLAINGEFLLDEPNVLVLDQAVSRIGNEPEAKSADYILNIDKMLRRTLQVPERGGAMAQPWLNAEEKAPSKTLKLNLKYTVVCESVPTEDCLLGLEHPEYYTIKLNGHKLSHKDTGSWCDRSIRTLPLPCKLLKSGENVLELDSVYHQNLPGLEAIFLLGRFGVRKGVITAMPERIAAGDVCTQGLENYSGNLTYVLHAECKAVPGKPVHLKMKKWRGVGMTVKVNDGPIQFVSWPPYELDITPLVRPGKNRIEIQVLGSRRNSHGPFYIKDHVTTPWSSDAGSMEAFAYPDKTLVPFGLLEDPVICE